MKTTVKGFVLKGVLKIVKKEKGEKGLKQLEQKFGSLKFSAFNDYPTETNAELRKMAAEVIYGKHDEETEYLFGKITFESYADSLIGKTMFSLLGNNLKKVAMGLPKILSTVNKGLESEVEDLGSKKVRIRMKNNPYHIKYHEGVWAAGAEFFKEKYKITSRVLAPGDYEYVMEWK